MVVQQIVRIYHLGRNATSVSDFYYRGYDFDKEKGNGLRIFAKGMIKSGEIKERTVSLDENGEKLVTITIFRDVEAYKKWKNSDVLAKAMEDWGDRDWFMDEEVINCIEHISLTEELG